MEFMLQKGASIWELNRVLLFGYLRFSSLSTILNTYEDIT